MLEFHINLNSRASESSLSHEDMIKRVNQANAQLIYKYQQKVDSINFAAVIIRSDIAHSAFKLSEFLTNPSDFHVKCANRVIKYLKHTKYLSIVYDAQIDDSRTIFFDSSDAFFADDIETRHNSQEYDFMLFNDLVN